jgi:hypothetical protein
MDCVIWIVLYLAQCVIIAIGALFFTYQVDSYLYVNMVGGLITISGSIALYLGYLLDKYSELKKENKSNIIKEFIKAKYNKLCPRITWSKND